MIFTTATSRNAVLSKIVNKQSFSDLTKPQMSYIRGMYHAIDDLEDAREEFAEISLSDDYSIIDRMKSQVTVEALDNIIEKMQLDILDVYVSFCEANMEDEYDS